MNELSSLRIVVLSPPFYSHFRPLLALARALAGNGAQVIMGCTADFEPEVRVAGIGFSEVVINRNKNRGVAEETRQEVEEKRRLNEFLESTKLGPVETLITQGRHRTADMFSNPDELIERVDQINREVKPALWVVDQLSYAATFAMHGFGLTYATFCAPHPYSIPAASAVYSVPPEWPAPLTPERSDLDRLVNVAQEVDASFTTASNSILQSRFGKDPVQSAFSVSSPTAVIYNYPPFPHLAKRDSRSVFAGHSYSQQNLTPKWEEVLSSKNHRVLIALGTFLASRGDVLTKLVKEIRARGPDSQILVGVGASIGELEGDESGKVFAERFIAQRALIPNVDLVVHHGGVSSFTEALYAGKPMIVLPFSSDQFNVARDVERYDLGSVADPNRFTGNDLEEAMQKAESGPTREAVHHWSEVVRSLGPRSAAKQLLKGGAHGTP